MKLSYEIETIGYAASYKICDTRKHCVFSRGKKWTVKKMDEEKMYMKNELRNGGNNSTGPVTMRKFLPIITSISAFRCSACISVSRRSTSGGGGSRGHNMVAFRQVDQKFRWGLVCFFHLGTVFFSIILVVLGVNQSDRNTFVANAPSTTNAKL